MIDLLPIGADEVARCVPIYETMAGWSDTTFGVKLWEDLPANAQAYLNRLEVLCEVPIAIVSVSYTHLNDIVSPACLRADVGARRYDAFFSAGGMA